jgi:septum formation protein
MSPPDVILASRSSARSALLRGAGVPFETADSGVDETVLKTAILGRGGSPAEVADQTLDFEGRLHDKPASLAEAAQRLRAMRGRPHALHAAVAAARDGAVIWETLSTAELVMRPFSDTFLEAYLASEGEEVLTSVGAYRLEGPGVQLFSEIRGDYFTILGLPLTGLLDLLRREGVLAP